MRTAALLCTLLAAGAANAQTVPQIAALLRDARLGEISGMTVSARTQQRLWLHNDSGARPEMFAIDTRGRLQARLVLDGVKPVDWEDMAAFELDGKSYLLLADTGDNGGVRERSELVIVEEPALDGGSRERLLVATPAWRIGFRYADAPHDVEAVAVDALNETVLLLTKRTSPPQIWSLPLRPGNRADHVAQPAGTLAVPQEPVPAVNFQRRLLPGRPTGFAISRDGRSAAVLTYASVWLYRRSDGERWTQALARTPQVFPFALLAQAEAVAIDATGARIFVSGERWPAPLLRLDLPPVSATP